MSSALQTLNEQNKAADWAVRIAECRNSGLSMREWCSEHNICTQTYDRWQKRLFRFDGYKPCLFLAVFQLIKLIVPYKIYDDRI